MTCKKYHLSYGLIASKTRALIPIFNCIVNNWYVGYIGKICLNSTGVLRPLAYLHIFINKTVVIKCKATSPIWYDSNLVI